MPTARESYWLERQRYRTALNVPQICCHFLALPVDHLKICVVLELLRFYVWSCNAKCKGTLKMYVNKLCKRCIYLIILFDLGWLSIHARHTGYKAVFSLYLARSTLRSNNFMMNVWCGCDGVGEDSFSSWLSFFPRFGGRPRLGRYDEDLGSIESLSSSDPPTTLLSAPFSRPRATSTSLAKIKGSCEKIDFIQYFLSTLFFLPF